MAVFVFKVFTIAIKTLARPLINWVTYYNRLKMQESEHKFAVFTRNKLIRIGQTLNYYNSLLNKKIFGLTKETTIKTLTPDKALERGAELISEIVVYSILLSLPVYEMIKSFKTNKIKNEKKKEYLLNIQRDCQDMVELRSKNLKNLNEIKMKLKKLDEEIYSV
jgi:hypothetical protein